MTYLIMVTLLVKFNLGKYQYFNFVMIFVLAFVNKSLFYI